jgi:hypothetical protein
MAIMNKAFLSAIALAFTIGFAGCGNEGDAGGEAGTPAQNIPEAEPEGVGGTSNQ